MLSSIKFRLWLTYLLVVGLMLGIAGLTLGVFLLRNPVQDRRELQRLKLVSNLIAQRNLMINLDPPIDTPRLLEVLRRSDRLSRARIAIYNNGGELLLNSRFESAPPLPEWAYFAGLKSNTWPVFKDATGRQWLYEISSLRGGSKLLVTVPLQRMALLTIRKDDFLAPFILASIIALTLTVLLSFWVANWISAPLRRLEAGTRQASSGRYEKVPIQGPAAVKNGPAL